MRNNRLSQLTFFLLAGIGVITPTCRAEEEKSLFSKSNLVAWCIVPFDANKRSPQQRAKMLKRLGLKKVAYDWRNEHVDSFEAEIVAYQENGLEFFAFWDVHDAMFQLFKRHQIKPQVWKMLPQPQGNSQHERVESAANRLLPLVKRTREMGSKLGIYNHGGWTGEPVNMVAVVKWLRSNSDADHVGIVYNFHHGHQHIEQFADHFAKMQPYLLCVNINGMNDDANPKILELGKGKHERTMLKIVSDSGYRGPIGILDHKSELDTETVLKGNLSGLRRLSSELNGRQP